MITTHQVTYAGRQATTTKLARHFCTKTIHFFFRLRKGFLAAPLICAWHTTHAEVPHLPPIEAISET